MFQQYPRDERGVGWGQLQRRRAAAHQHREDAARPQKGGARRRGDCEHRL